MTQNDHAATHQIGEGVELEQTGGVSALRIHQAQHAKPIGVDILLLHSARLNVAEIISPFFCEYASFSLFWEERRRYLEYSQ
jgi:hypothetical protein